MDTLILKVKCERCHKQLLSSPVLAAPTAEQAHVLKHLCQEAAIAGPEFTIWTESKDERK